jgi:hypothetical protein
MDRRIADAIGVPVEAVQRCDALDHLLGWRLSDAHVALLQDEGFQVTFDTLEGWERDLRRRPRVHAGRLPPLLRRPAP